MPRTPENNEIIRTTRRDEIFRAASRVFAKKGFAATKIADIAAEAGLSHGLLYHYFRSKEAVYTALLDEMIQKKPTHAEVVGDARTGIERVERLVKMWLARVTERPELGVLVSQAYLSDTLPQEARDAFIGFARESYHDLTTDLRTGQREGSVTKRVSAEELAVAIGSLVRGLSLVRFVYAAVSPEGVTPSLETVMRMVRATSEEVRDGAGTGRMRSPAMAARAASARSNGKKKQKEDRRAARA
jgi:AcrR family transcriptional regulator